MLQRIEQIDKVGGSEQERYDLFCKLGLTPSQKPA